MTMGQALRKAAAAERGGARFYRMLADKSETERAYALFAKLSNDERKHAEALERHADQLASGDHESELPEPALRNLEYVPGWEDVDTIGADQAVEIALEAEIHAALFYSTLADLTEGEVRGFFEGLTQIEERHAELLRDRRAELVKQEDVQ
jgi:rubrerythrin